MHITIAGPPRFLPDPDKLDELVDETDELTAAIAPLLRQWRLEHPDRNDDDAAAALLIVAATFVNGTSGRRGFREYSERICLLNAGDLVGFGSW